MTSAWLGGIRHNPAEAQPMADYITLLGAEQVASAGHAMREAGNQMERAASNISGAMDRFERLIERFEAACSQIDRGAE